LNLAGKIPLKFGHNDAQPLTDGQPALGWVSRVYREGKKLLADFTNMPTQVYEAIKSGLYKFVSIELLGDVQADTRVIPWVLDAVALLGADPPAVGNLKDLQQLTMAKGSGLQSRTRVAFTRDQHTGGDKPNMADDPKGNDIATLMSRLDKLETEKKALEVKAAERESFERKLNELETATRNDKIAAHRKQVVELFEAAIKAKTIVPAVRERFKRAYRLETDAIMDVTITDVEAFIKDNPNPDAPRKVVGLSGETEVSSETRADDRVVHFAKKYVRDNANDPEFSRLPHWQKLSIAAQRVMAADPELGKSYKHLPETIEAGGV